MGAQHIHAMRRAEFEFVSERVQLGGKILEIGAGDGFLAAEMAKHADVVAIDVAPHSDCFFPVQPCDGRQMPFPDATFDLVFSAHVLEHVACLADLHSEMRRVLKPGGRAVHVVPSALWRLWTSLAHYPVIPRQIARRLATPHGNGSAAASGNAPGLLRRALYSPRHGERGTVLAEMILFSAHAWRAEMERGGWMVEELAPTGLFYTGVQTFAEHLSAEARRTIGRGLGSSSLLLVTS